MRLTPLDIRKQEFKKAMRGLDADEVYAFLATIADEYEAVINDNKALRERLLELDDKVQEYRNMEKTLRDTLLTAERVTVSASVKNTGERAGEEVVQCYTGDVVASRVRPVKALQGFQKIALAPGECQTVTFDLPVAALGFYDVDNHFIVEPGKFKVWVGPSSAEGLEGEFWL